MKPEYEDIPSWRALWEVALNRDDPGELLRLVIAVGLHHDDFAEASRLSLHLAAHAHPQVRANALLALGHLARRFGEVLPEAMTLVQQGMKDADRRVRSQATAAADDIEHFTKQTQ